MAVLSQNIANANTVGYSRQMVAQSSVNIEGIGNGVKFDEVIRKMDKISPASGSGKWLADE